MNAAHPSADLAALHNHVTVLTERVERMESIEAIRALRARYHELVNEDAGNRLYELFAPDAYVAYGGRPEVRDDIGRRLARAASGSLRSED